MQLIFQKEHHKSWYSITVALDWLSFCADMVCEKEYMALWQGKNGPWKG